MIRGCRKIAEFSIRISVSLMKEKVPHRIAESFHISASEFRGKTD